MLDFVIAFPGQGSYDLDEFKRIYDKNSVCQKVLNEAEEILGFPIKPAMFSSTNSVEKFNTCYYSQLRTFLSSYSLWLTIEPLVSKKSLTFCGHSLGELNALVAANVISFPDALKYLHQRATLMDQCCYQNPGKMMAVMDVSNEDLIDLLEGSPVQIANYNSKHETIVSGPIDCIEQLNSKLQTSGIRSVPLKVQGAFHSDMMLEASVELRKYPLMYDEKNLNKVYSSFLKRWFQETDDLGSLLSAQVILPVYWRSLVIALSADYYSNVIEVSTKPVLKKFFLNEDSSFEIIEARDTNCANLINDSIQGKLLSLCKKVIAILVSTKNRASDEDYDIYRNGYQNLLSRCNSLIANPEQVSISVCRMFLEEAFKSLIQRKGTPIEEIEFRKGELNRMFHLQEDIWDF